MKVLILFSCFTVFLSGRWCADVKPDDLVSNVTYTDDTKLCPDNWIYFRAVGFSLCYYIHWGNVSYIEAKETCLNMNSSLYTTSLSVPSYLVLAYSDEYKASFWGLTKPDKEEQDACKSMMFEGTSEVSCNEKMGYICMKNLSDLHIEPTCNSGGRTSVSALFNDTCYTVGLQKTDFKTADEICRYEESSLVNSSNQFILSLMKAIAVFHERELWVGPEQKGTDTCNIMTKTGLKYKIPPDDLCVKNGSVEALAYCERPLEIRQHTTSEYSYTTVSYDTPDVSSPIELKTTTVTTTRITTPTTEATTIPTTASTTTRAPTLLCPLGMSWKTSSASSPWCYWETTFERSRLNWEEGEEFCQSYDGHLASYGELNEEHLALSSARGHAGGLWIGLKRIRMPNGTSDLRWSDGSPLNYTNWDKGEPKINDAKKNCVTHSGAESKWRLSYCGTQRWFVCKVPKSPHPKAGAEPTVILDVCEDVQSFDMKRWYKFGDYCYLMQKQAKYSWDLATQYCYDRGGALASIHSFDEVDFALRVIRGVSDSPLWIGLRSRGLHSSFKWSDGTPLNFMNWDEDNNDTLDKLRNNIDSCVVIDKYSGFWNVEHCNRLQSVLCKRKFNVSTSAITTTTTTTAFSVGFCPNGWYVRGNYCYKPFGRHSEKRRHWGKAQEHCESLGAHLVTIHSQDQQDFLTDLVLDIKYATWTGLNASIRGSLFHWVDNSALDYTNWDSYEPFYGNSAEDCVEMIYERHGVGRWNDVNCHSSKGYICQMEKDPTLDGPGEDPSKCTHHKDWFRLGESCYQLFGDEVNKETWVDSQIYCLQNEANLGNLNSYGLVTVLRHVLSNMGDDVAWIGAREASKNTYNWMYQDHLTYTNWITGQPNRVSDHDNCVAANKEGGWMVRNCNEKHVFLCEYNRENFVTNPPILNLTCPNTPNDTWIDVGTDSCFLLVSENWAKYETARTQCLDKGGDLASFHSAEELEVLRPYINRVQKPLYIGLVQNALGNYEWTDGSPVDFIAWYDGEPNLHGQELCTEIYSDVLQFNNIYCSQTRPYICSAKKVTIPEAAAALNDTYTEHVRRTVAVDGIIGIVVCIVIVILAAGMLYYYFCYNKQSGRARLSSIE